MKASIGICVVFAAGLAAAHEGSDPLAVWYRSPTTADGKSCCAMHDCVPNEARMKEGHWEVLIFSYNADYARWFPVPDNVVLRRENPDGRSDPLPHAKRIHPLLCAAARQLTPSSTGCGDIPADPSAPIPQKRRVGTKNRRERNAKPSPQA